jgi:hypothetical protein
MFKLNPDLKGQFNNVELNNIIKKKTLILKINFFLRKKSYICNR